MERAILIARYLIEPGVYAFEKMLGGRTLADAERIMTYVRHKRMDTFSRRDARRAFSRAIQKSPECDWRLSSALGLMLSMGWITEKEVPEQEKPKTGRPHSQEYIVVPNP